MLQTDPQENVRLCLMVARALGVNPHVIHARLS